MDECFEYLNKGAKEYLLDGNTHNKGIIEQTLEAMARMGLDDKTEWRMVDGVNVAIRFSKVYDRFTQWRREHAIMGECLGYSQFLKQMKNSDLFIEHKDVWFDSGNVKATILNFSEILDRCDLTTFSGSDINTF